jgi:hypothetical protein
VFRQVIFVGILALAMVFFMPSHSHVNAVKCEDIKYEGKDALKWGDTAHGDNTPSESKFNKMVEGSASICEVAKCYDHDECKGEITKGEWKDFRESIVYVGTSDDVDECLDKRMDLGGELKDYEIHHCAVGSY